MKNLYIPAKTWLDIKSFTKEFPHTQLPLVILFLDKTMRPHRPFQEVDILTTFYNTFVLGIDTWQYNNKINAYKNIVQFVLSPDKPISFDFEPKLEKPSLPTPTARTTGFAQYGIWAKNFTASQKYGAIDTAKIAEVLQYRNLGEGKGIVYTGGCCSLSTGKGGKFINYGFAPRIFDINAKDPNTLVPVGFSNISCKNNNCPIIQGVTEYEAILRTQENNAIEYILNNGFKTFRAMSQSEWINFNEVYGINDIKQVPHNTISYAVTNQSPPVDPEINWKTIDFWSKVFDSEMGKAILSAVASNMPTTITTRVENWKDPNQPSIKKFETEKEWVEIYNYVFQDFEIIVGEKNNILIRYNRGADSSTITIKKKEAWKKFLQKAIIGLAIIPIGLAAGAAVGLVSPTVGGASATVTQGVVASTPISGLASGATATAITGATGTVTGVSGTIAAGTVAKATLWSTIIKAAPAVGSTALKLGTQLWTEGQKQKFAEEMAKAGIDANAINYAMPEGIDANGNPIYAQDGKFVTAGITGGNMLITILLFSGAGLVLSLLLGGKKE